MPEEKRIDDGEAFTWGDFSSYYKKNCTKKEIAAYWEMCEVAKASIVSLAFDENSTPSIPLVSSLSSSSVAVMDSLSDVPTRSESAVGSWRIPDSEGGDTESTRASTLGASTGRNSRQSATKLRKASDAEEQMEDMRAKLAEAEAAVLESAAAAAATAATAAATAATAAAAAAESRQTKQAIREQQLENLFVLGEIMQTRRLQGRDPEDEQDHNFVSGGFREQEQDDEESSGSSEESVCTGESAERPLRTMLCESCCDFFHGNGSDALCQECYIEELEEMQR